MIVCKSNSLWSHRAPRSPASTGGDRGNCHDAIGHHRPSFSKGRDDLRDDLANEPRLVFCAGTIAGRFIDFRPFHGGQYGDKAIQRIAR